MSKEVRVLLTDEQRAWLDDYARKLGKKPAEVLALLAEETKRELTYDVIDFRDSIVGREACVRGTGLAAWEVAMVARDYGDDVAGIADHLQMHPERVKEVLRYVADFHDEIQAELDENDSYTYDKLRKMLPHSKFFPEQGEEADEAATAVER